MDHRCKVNKINDDIKMPVSVVQYLDYLTTIKGTSVATGESYRNNLGLFFRFMKIHKKKSTAQFNNIDISNIDDKFIKSIKLVDLHSFLSYCQKERENGENARARKVAVLKSYFNYLEDIAETITINPTKKLANPKIPKRNPIYLTLEESKRVLTSFDKNNTDYNRNYCVFVVLLNTGIRISELMGIKLNNIRENILTVIGKGNKMRDIPLNNACIKAIENHLNSRNNDKLSMEEQKYLINLGKQGIEDMVKSSIIKAGIVNGEDYTPHKLRHTASTLMWKYGKTDVVTLKQILGHESLATTQIYTHCDREDIKVATDNNPLADF